MQDFAAAIADMAAAPVNFAPPAPPANQAPALDLDAAIARAATNAASAPQPPTGIDAIRDQLNRNLDTPRATGLDTPPATQTTITPPPAPITIHIPEATDDRLIDLLAQALERLTSIATNTQPTTARDPSDSNELTIVHVNS